MVAARIFLCHAIDEEAQRETHLLQQLRQRMQEERASVISYAGKVSETGFLSFLHQQLPTCQWFVLVQTPSALSTSSVQVAMSTALKLQEQQQLKGVARLIAKPSDQQEVPVEWSATTTFDATYDYPRAIEKLLLALSLNTPTSVVPPPSAYRSVHTLASTYDRPPEAPSPAMSIKAALHRAGRSRKKTLTILIALLILTLLSSILAASLLNRPAPTAAKSINKVNWFGTLYFSSTGPAGMKETGIEDGLDIRLQNLKPPAAGNSYYAWLLPDKKNFHGLTLLIGSFTPTRGSAHLTYKSPQHINLLANDSRFLVTEESSSPTPAAPTANKEQWRYYGELPQEPDPKDAKHYSDLDHLRHLLSGGETLSDDEKMNMSMLKGGLTSWLYQNTQKILEWSLAARGTTQASNAAFMKRHFVRILTYLDGVSAVYMDIPKDTPLGVDTEAARIPILKIDQNMMSPSYIEEIELHLLALSNSPNSTKKQQKLAGQLDEELNKVKVLLAKVRDDANQLFSMDDDKLLAPETEPLLDDLVNESTTAFSGVVDPATGVRKGGTLWIFDQTQQLAQLTIKQYKYAS